MALNFVFNFGDDGLKFGDDGFEINSKVGLCDRTFDQQFSGRWPYNFRTMVFNLGTMVLNFQDAFQGSGTAFHGGNG